MVAVIAVEHSQAWVPRKQYLKQFLYHGEYLLLDNLQIRMIPDGLFENQANITVRIMN